MNEMNWDTAVRENACQACRSSYCAKSTVLTQTHLKPPQCKYVASMKGALSMWRLIGPRCRPSLRPSVSNPLVSGGWQPRDGPLPSVSALAASCFPVQRSSIPAGGRGREPPVAPQTPALRHGGQQAGEARIR